VGANESPLRSDSSLHSSLGRQGKFLTMDTISLALSKWEDDEDAISFMINGRDLIQIIQEQGGHGDVLLVRSICFGREDTVFREHSRVADERLIVLACTCGSPYCTSITVRVQRSDTEVVWSDFAPSWLGAWNTGHRVGPFRFPRDNYEDLLQEGRRLCYRLDA